MCFTLIQLHPQEQLEYKTVLDVTSERGLAVNWRGHTHTHTIALRWIYTHARQPNIFHTILNCLNLILRVSSIHAPHMHVNTHTNTHMRTPESVWLSQPGQWWERTLWTQHNKGTRGEKNKSAAWWEMGSAPKQTGWQSGHTLSGQLGATGHDLKPNSRVCWWFVVCVRACMSAPWALPCPKACPAKEI